MKQYQSCELEIIVLNELDVITTSQQGTNVAKDYFDDSWWVTNQGGDQ